jgi:hypothetical protein
MFELSEVRGTLIRMAEFTDEHREILDFEHIARWKYAGAKEAAIRDQFGVSSVRYYQMLNWAIDQPEALEHDPMGVRRLRRLRAQRAARRSGRERGFDLATAP